MSSINPVLLMPAALAARGAALGRAFAGSLTMGAGQFCTSPGLLLAVPGPGLDAFLAAAVAALEAGQGRPCCTPASPGPTKPAWRGCPAPTASRPWRAAARGRAPTTAAPRCSPTDADAFLADRSLGEEVFGASSLLVRCDDAPAMRAVLEHLEGQLTVTLQMDEADTDAVRALLPILERRAGRVLANGWPTGWRSATPWCTAARPGDLGPAHHLRGQAWRSGASCAGVLPGPARRPAAGGAAPRQHDPGCRAWWTAPCRAGETARAGLTLPLQRTGHRVDGPV